MDYGLLRNEILFGPKAVDCAPFVILPTDPKASSIETMQKDNAIAAILNELHPTELVYQHISVAEAMIWAATGPMKGIVEAADDPMHPAHASCYVVRLLFAGDPKQNIEFNKQQVRDMFAGWYIAGVIMKEEYDSLMSMSSRQASYAEAVGLGPVTGANVSNALRGGNGFEVING